MLSTARPKLDSSRECPMTLPAATLDTHLQRPRTRLQVHQPDVSNPSRKIQTPTHPRPRPSLPLRSHRPTPLTTRYSSTSQPWPTTKPQSRARRWSPSPSSRATREQASFHGANPSTGARSNFSGPWNKPPRWQSLAQDPRSPAGSVPNECPGLRTRCGTRLLVSEQLSSKGLDRQSRLYSRCMPFPTSSRGRTNHARTSWTASDSPSTCYIIMSHPQTRPPKPTKTPC